MVTNVLFEQWKPVSSSIGELYLKKIIHDNEGLWIYLGDIEECFELEIIFKSPLAYQNIDESYRLRTWSESDGYKKGTLFKVQGSSWKNYFLQECLGMFSSDEVEHYAVLTQDDCIDILSIDKPEVTII